LAAFNVKGTNGNSLQSPNHKWHDLHQMLFDEKIGVIVVSETHLSTERADEIQESHMKKRMKIFNSPDPENPTGAKGVAVVLNRELTNIEGVRVKYLIPGRAILVSIPWHKKASITILAIYAPAESAREKEEFWNELTEMWIDPENDMPAIDWLGGDINLVLNQMDRLPQKEDDTGAVAALTRFLHIVNLIDGWREANPHAKEYTFTSTATPPTHARLDRLYVPKNHFKRYRGWSIDNAGGHLSDHRMVSVTLTTPGSPYIGKGRYTIPLQILHDREFRDYAIHKGAKLEAALEEERMEERNPQTLFHNYKRDVLDCARERAKVTVGATEQK
ncbi:Endonuclease/exonuclease/phosphatase, partial [Mycena amicta]